MNSDTAMIRYISAHVLAAFLFAHECSAATFTVTDTGDAGGACLTVCTLRSAITEANGSTGPHTILFSMPGSGVQTIQPATELPAIIEPVNIDATPNALPDGTPQIEIKGDRVSGNGLSFTVGGSGSTIKGVAVTSFDTGAGIVLTGTSGVTIISNWIGVNPSNGAADGNSVGIYVEDSTGSVIGAPGNGNVISGNTAVGLDIYCATAGQDTQHVISGNIIGADSRGGAQIANALVGLRITNCKNNTIGGSDAGASRGALGDGNLITGGIAEITTLVKLDSSDENDIAHNIIGSNLDVSARLGSPETGILIENASNNAIGSMSGTAAPNWISGAASGIYILGGTEAGHRSRGNLVVNNLIGTSYDGQSAVPNATTAVLLASGAGVVDQNRIGLAGSGNVVSGNSGTAIRLDGAQVTNNSVVGNLIGVARDGVTPLPNDGDGVWVTEGGTENVVGGSSAAGEANTIAYNGGSGVSVYLGSLRISQNSIFDNAFIGIDLLDTDPEASGPVSENDIGDADTGGNGMLNYPAFSVLPEREGAGVRISGVLRSAPRKAGRPAPAFTIEYFLNEDDDPLGYGEGKTFLGNEQVTTDGRGVAVLDRRFSELAITDTQSISATATDEAGNTSEFSVATAATEELNQGETIDDSPSIRIDDDDVTLTFENFEPPSRSKDEAAAQASRNPSGGRRVAQIQYQATVRNTGTNTTAKKLSKRNTLTLRDLPPGNYTSTYNVRLVGASGRVRAKSRQSPSAEFKITD